MSNIFYEKAQQHFKNQNFELAVVDYTEALVIEPHNADIYADRAVAYYHLQKLDLALKDKNKAAELQPKNPYRYSSRAYIKSAMRNIEGAIEDYEKCIELDPDDAIAYNNLGLLQEKLGYMNKSKSSMAKADELADKQGLNYWKVEKEEPKINLTEPNFIEEDKPNKGSQIDIVKEVFTTKKGFSEFITFVKNGFKK